MLRMEVRIEECSLNEVLDVLREVPEFEQMKEDKFYFDKLGNKVNLMLIAKTEHEIVACKGGYDRYNDGSFYSWLGGVKPQYRKQGIAQKLADYQETWARQKGFKVLKLKTLNRHRNMLMFAIKNGFDISGVKETEELEKYKINLVKTII